jgi:hypothetical protein
VSSAVGRVGLCSVGESDREEDASRKQNCGAPRGNDTNHAKPEEAGIRPRDKNNKPGNDWLGGTCDVGGGCSECCVLQHPPDRYS